MPDDHVHLIFDPHIGNVLLIIGIVVVILLVVSTMLYKLNIWSYSIALLIAIAGSSVDIGTRQVNAAWAIGAAVAVMLLYKFVEFCMREYKRGS